MLFWMACEELKQESNKSVIEEKARLIYEDYISILSPKEVYYCLKHIIWCCFAAGSKVVTCLKLQQYSGVTFLPSMFHCQQAEI